jgi:hypothetical protein
MAESSTANAGNGAAMITDIAKLLGPMVFGSGTTAGTTTTSKSSSVDPSILELNKQLFASLGLQADDAEGQTAGIVDRIIQKAAINFAPTLSGQHQAGMYNTTVLGQLNGEAMAAASKEALGAVLDFKTNTQKLQAGVGTNLLSSGPRTETNTTAQTSRLQPSIKPGVSGLVGAGLLGKSIYDWMNKPADAAGKVKTAKDAVDFLGSNEEAGILTGEEVAGKLGGSTTVSAAPASASSEIAAGQGLSEAAANTADIVTGSNALTQTIAADAIGPSSAINVAEGVAGAGVDGAGTVASGVEGLGTEAVDVAGSLTESAIGADVVTGAAGELAGAGYAVGETLAAGLGTEAAVGAGLPSAGGFIVEELAGASLLEEVAPLALAWVICTELKNSGELSDELYAAGVKRLPKLSKHVIKGYHYWAIPYTRLMRRSKAARNFIKPGAIGRASYLAGNFNILGFLTVFVGEPLCWILGKVVSTVEDYNTLYQTTLRVKE